MGVFVCVGVCGVCGVCGGGGGGCVCEVCGGVWGVCVCVFLFLFCFVLYCDSIFEIQK